MNDLERSRSNETWATVCLFIVSITALGLAVQINNGAFEPTAFRLLNVALACCLVAPFVPRIGAFERRGPTWARVFAGAAAVVQFATLLSNPLGVYLGLADAAGLKSQTQSLAAAAVLGGIAVMGQPRIRGIWLPLLVVPHLLVGLWIVKTAPLPHIDVFYFQRDSSAALLHGVNPYTLTFPNIYGEATPFYGPNMSVNGRLQFGYPYPPLSLFIAIAGHLFGDFRYAQLFAIELAALLMAYCRKGILGPIAAVLYLYTPRSFFVLEQGWTEPYLVLLLSACTFAACRAPRLVPYALGLFLAVKQYLVLAVLPAVQLLRRGARPKESADLFLRAAAVSAVVTLPLALWNFKAFFWDVVALQIYQPFRNDALSYLAWWAQDHPISPPSAIAFGAAIVATAIALLRFPRSPAGFSGSIALVFFAFFAFNKQAFCNYYFFVIGALCTTVSAARA